MAANTAIRADRPGARIRRPRQYAKGRVCSNPECDTVISRYNREAACFRHRPVVYPRIRGKFSEDFFATD